MPLPIRFCLLVGLCLLAGGASSQPITFGHAADPHEAQTRTGFAPAARNEVLVRAGPSYIDDRWRLFGGIEARLATGPFGLGVTVPGRTGVGGPYEEDYDEGYDVLRRLSYARLDPSASLPVYARLGPIERLRLGTGLLVEGFATTAAWERRTIGAEAAARLGAVHIAGFAEDVRLDGLVGGLLTVQPLRNSTGRFQRTLLTLEGVYDLALDGTRGDSLDRPFAAGATLRAPLWGDAFAIGPYAAGAYQQGLGSDGGISAEGGLEATADRFADLVDLRVRLGAFGFGEGVRVAPFDAFYPLTRGERTVVLADPFFEEPGAPRRPASLAASDIEAGWGLVFALDVRLGESLVLAQASRLPVDGQPVGLHRLHAAYATSGGLRFRFAFERAGLNRVSDFFRGFDADLTTLVFDIDYPVSPRLVVSMRSRYGFTALPPLAPDAPTAFLVERRFEPTLGFRLRF